MWRGFPLFPEQASSVAGDVDALYYYLVSVGLFFSIGIFIAIFYMAVKYRRRRPDELPQPIEGSLILELTWSGVPLILTMIMFVWGAVIYFRMYRPPATATEIQVVGKQWMWKIQHPEGRREISELHVPVGRAVRLKMISEDVIHSFYIPAFRVKQDVLPGRYTQMWFQATKVGEYHLFCAEYCGTQHSGMIGKVTVMEPSDYEQWLAGGAGGQSQEQAGEALFSSLFCNTCHKPGGRGPMLEGVYGQQMRLTTGDMVTVDDSYIRESILNPSAKVLEGYAPVMPPYKGQVSEEQILQLIAYIKSMSRAQQGQPQTQRSAPPARKAGQR